MNPETDKADVQRSIREAADLLLGAASRKDQRDFALLASRWSAAIEAACAHVRHLHEKPIPIRQTVKDDLTALSTQSLKLKRQITKASTRKAIDLVARSRNSASYERDELAALGRLDIDTMIQGLSDLSHAAKAAVFKLGLKGNRGTDAGAFDDVAPTAKLWLTIFGLNAFERARGSTGPRNHKNADLNRFLSECWWVASGETSDDWAASIMAARHKKSRRDVGGITPLVAHILAHVEIDKLIEKNGC